MVISLIATSKFFGAGEKRPEKGVFTHFTFGTPISLASASAKSTSKPLGLSIGSSTNPATGNSAPTVRVPGCLRSSAPPCPEAPDPPAPLPPLSSPPHPAIVSAATTTATAHTSFVAAASGDRQCGDDDRHSPHELPHATLHRDVPQRQFSD